MSIGEKVFWAVCVFLFVFGLFLSNEDVTTYSTNEYWVAKNYSHVYEQYSGEIVNVIEDDEICKMKKDEIIVRKKIRGNGAYTTGKVIVIMTGGCIAYAVIGSIIESVLKERRGY